MTLGCDGSRGLCPKVHIVAAGRLYFLRDAHYSLKRTGLSCLASGPLGGSQLACLGLEQRRGLREAQLVVPAVFSGQAKSV